MKNNNPPLKDLTDRVCRSVMWNGKRFRALIPYYFPEDASLLEVVSRGEFSVNGFRNPNLRAFLSRHGQPSKNDEADNQDL